MQQVQDLSSCRGQALIYCYNVCRLRYDFKGVAWPDIITEAMFKISWIFNSAYLSTATAQKCTRKKAKSIRICMYRYNIMYDASKAVLFLWKFPRHPYTWSLDTAMNRSYIANKYDAKGNIPTKKFVPITEIHIFSYIASSKIIHTTCMFNQHITCCLESTIEMLIIYGMAVPSNYCWQPVCMSLFDMLRSWVSMCRSLVSPMHTSGTALCMVCIDLLVFFCF